jgi:large subunit ribosomal protein L4
MRRAALRSALSVKASAQQIVVLDVLTMATPKTKEIAAMLKNVSAEGKALLLLPESNETVELSTRNIPTAKTLRASYLNVRDILGADYVIMPVDALKVVESMLGSPVSVGVE